MNTKDKTTPDVTCECGTLNHPDAEYCWKCADRMPKPKTSTPHGKGSDAASCSACNGLRMMPSDDPNGDVMNTPCPECNKGSDKSH